jgi:hypothetical protein
MACASQLLLFVGTLVKYFSDRNEGLHACTDTMLSDSVRHHKVPSGKNPAVLLRHMLRSLVHRRYLETAGAWLRSHLVGEQGANPLPPEYAVIGIKNNMLKLSHGVGAWLPVRVDRGSGL